MGGVFFGGFRRADVHETFEGERREVGRVDVEDESAIILEKQGEQVELRVRVRSHDCDDQLRQRRCS